MVRQTNYKLKIDFLVSSNYILLSHPTQNTLESISKKCNRCNRRRKMFNEIDQICHQYHKAKLIPLSGNKVIDVIIFQTVVNPAQEN